MLGRRGMHVLTRGWSALALAAVCMLASGVAARDGPESHAAAQAEVVAAAQACYPPSQLQAAAGEEIVKKADHRFDAPYTETVLAPTPTVPDGLRGAIRRVKLADGRRLIALTFDLCEQQGEIAGYDGDIFDYLRQQNVAATLFVGGKWMRSHTTRAAQLASDPLFEIASHSDTHRNLRVLDAANINREIMGPQHTYEKLRAQLPRTQCVTPMTSAPSDQSQQPKSLPGRISLFRFPFGACNATALNAVNDAGLLAIQWDVSTGDPAKGQTAEAIAKAMVDGAKPGSIIIAHANGRGWNTAEALPLAIPKLKALGFEFVTVSTLLAAGKPVVVDSCYNVKPGDTDRYDFLSVAKNPVPAASPVTSTSPVSLEGGSAPHGQ